MEPFGCCGIGHYGTPALTEEREGCGHPSAGQCEGEQLKACKAKSERAEGDGGEGVKNQGKGERREKREQEEKQEEQHWEGRRWRECRSGRWMTLDGSFCAVKSSGVCRLASWGY